MITEYKTNGVEPHRGNGNPSNKFPGIIRWGRPTDISCLSLISSLEGTSILTPTDSTTPESTPWYTAVHKGASKEYNRRVDRAERRLFLRVVVAEEGNNNLGTSQAEGVRGRPDRTG